VGWGDAAHTWATDAGGCGHGCVRGQEGCGCGAAGWVMMAGRGGGRGAACGVAGGPSPDRGQVAGAWLRFGAVWVRKSGGIEGGGRLKGSGRVTEWGLS